MIKRLGCLAVGLMLLLGAATAHAQVAGTKPAPAAAPAQKVSGEEYILGPEDVVEVEVVGQPDKIRSKIYTDGTVQLALVGKQTLGGLTTRQAGDAIAKALKAGGFYANPVVNVEVVSISSRYVTVLGAVGQPGLVPISRPYRLSEILARVGGVQERAADYVVVRSEDGGEKHYVIEKLATGGGAEDPYVKPGDKIYFPIADVFYISGQVNAPGTYPVRTDMTVRQAIGRAGGLNEQGTDHNVQVNRNGKKIKLDVNAKILPNDVIVIGERLF